MKKVWDINTFFGQPNARIALQLFDNSVAVRASRDANLGMDPSRPTYIPPAIGWLAYSPAPIDPPNSNPPMLMQVYYQYTRCGLKGIDFGGKEVFGNSY